MWDKELEVWSLDWELSIGEGGGEEGQESQFTSVYSLFFMQAAIIAHNICSGFKAFKLIRKKKYIWEQHIYLQYKFLQYVYVFVHEAIYHTKINIYFNNQHVHIKICHNIYPGVQSSKT